MEDNFNNILSDKFKNHRPEVPPHLWSAIAQNVGKEKEHNKGLILFVWGLLTSTALCGMYLFNTLLQDQYPTYAIRLKPLPSLAHSTDNYSQNQNDFNDKVEMLSPLPLVSDQHTASSHYASASMPLVGTARFGPTNIDLKTKDTGPSTSTDNSTTPRPIYRNLSSPKVQGSKGAQQDLQQNTMLQVSLDNNIMAKSSSTALVHTAGFSGIEQHENHNTNNLTACLQDTLTQDTLQEDDTCVAVATLEEPQKTVKNDKKQKVLRQEASLSFSPFKVFNISDGIDQGYEIAAHYGRSLGKAKLHIGLAYTALGIPLHYEVPENPQMGVYFDPDKNSGNGQINSLPNQIQKQNHIILTSLHTLGLNLGVGYQKAVHQKWILETGLTVQPTVILKSSHINIKDPSNIEYHNGMGAHNFKTIGLNVKANANVAYRPIPRAELILGIQSGYALMSIHKIEKIKPLSVGPLFGLKWLF